jgi:hypothetical protein
MAMPDVLLVDVSSEERAADAASDNCGSVGLSG